MQTSEEVMNDLKLLHAPPGSLGGKQAHGFWLGSAHHAGYRGSTLSLVLWKHLGFLSCLNVNLI